MCHNCTRKRDSSSHRWMMRTNCRRREAILTKKRVSDFFPTSQFFFYLKLFSSKNFFFKKQDFQQQQNFIKQLFSPTTFFIKKLYSPRNCFNHETMCTSIPDLKTLQRRNGTIWAIFRDVCYALFLLPCNFLCGFFDLRSIFACFIALRRKTALFLTSDNGSKYLLVLAHSLVAP